MKKIVRKNQGLGWRQIVSLHKYSTVVEYEILAFWQAKAQVFNSLLWLPILNPLFFGAGLASFAPTTSTLFGTSNYLAFIFPGIVGLGFFRVCSHIIYRLTVERRYGLQGLKIGAGAGVLGYMLGHLTLPAIVAVFQSLVTMSVLVLLSTPIGSMHNVLLMLGVGMISAWFWGVLGIFISFSFKNYTQRDFVMSLLMVPMTLASPAFYPLQNAPRYLQMISSCNPLTYNIVAMREAFLYGKLSSSFLLTIILTLTLLIGNMMLISKKEFLDSKT